jgi:cobyrinic acid a,c-diamide synthase
MTDKPELISESAKGIALASEKAFEFLYTVLTSPVKELTGILTTK